MVLHPTTFDTPPRVSSTSVPAWDAVSRSQKQPASSWWLIAQPDHAALAGDLASNLATPLFPALDPEVLEAIALHDAGWAQFDNVDLPSRNPSTPNKSAQLPIPKDRPLSFLDVKPVDFLIAWRVSIERAARSSAIGGFLVSHHFSRIGQTRLRLAGDAAEDTEIINDFLVAETRRRQGLERHLTRSPKEIELLVDVLQFCDLLSLYLCCGSPEAVEFPQRFGAQTVRAWREGLMCVTGPPLFGSGVSLGVTAMPFENSSEPPHAATLPFLLS
jgi:hypothetical protein